MVPGLYISEMACNSDKSLCKSVMILGLLWAIRMKPDVVPCILYNCSLIDSLSEPEGETSWSGWDLMSLAELSLVDLMTLRPERALSDVRWDSF